MQTAQNEPDRHVTIKHRTEIECKACGDRWRWCMDRLTGVVFLLW